MEEIKLKAEAREVTGNQVGALRREDMIPAIMYGPAIDNRNLSIDLREFEKVYKEAGDSTLIDLTVGEEAPVKVIVQALQRHPLKHQITHVDLFQVKMDEAITASVALKLVGEAPAIKSYGGMLMHNLDSVEVRCLPTALVSEIEVDLSGLAEIGDGINVGDLVAPEGMEILTEDDVSIVMIQAPKKEEEEIAPAEGEEAALPEGAEENKEGAEGEEKKAE